MENTIDKVNIRKIEEMGLTQFEYEHCEQSTSEHQPHSRRRRYLLMAGIFGVVLVISSIIIVVVALNYQEENKCVDDLKCMLIKDCEGKFLSDITFPCAESKICCKPKLSTRTEVHEKTRAERLRKKVLLKEDCGLLPLQDKLADGEDATLGEFPWMAVLGYTAPIDSGQSVLQFECGGTLISDEYVLTAAHCIKQSLTTVYLGTINLTSVRFNTTECYIYEDGTKTCTYPSKFIVENVITHPEYNSRNLKNDIALIKLNQKVNKSEEFIKKICLPFELNVDQQLGWKNFTFSMTGWGLTEHRGSIHNKLQQVKKVVAWKYDRCTDNLAQYKELLPITKKQICATGQNFSEACQGDSGGPLSHIYHVATQVGIISFKPLGETCGTEKQPTIFTRVDGYLDWILDNIDI